MDELSGMEGAGTGRGGGKAYCSTSAREALPEDLRQSTASEWDVHGTLQMGVAVGAREGVGDTQSKGTLAPGPARL